MKKIFVLPALAFCFTGLLFSGSLRANNIEQTLTAKSSYDMYRTLGIDYHYEMGGCDIRVCVDFYGIGDDGNVHGVTTITVTDRDGNTLTWNEPFSSKTHDTRLANEYPEVEQMFQNDIIRLTGQ